MTNCTVGITGLERERANDERESCENQGQRCGPECMNMYACVCVCVRVASLPEKTHCFSFMEVEDSEMRGAVWCYLVFQGKTTSGARD